MSLGKLRTKAQTTHNTTSKHPLKPLYHNGSKVPPKYQRSNMRNTPLSKHPGYQRVQNTPVFVLFLHVTSLVSFKKKIATRKERNI